MDKLFATFLICLGEGLAIYAEMFLARTYGAGTRFVLTALAIMTVGGVCLVFGYAMSYVAFKNIWIVAAISVTAIFIIEPVLAWTMIHEIPTRGAVIGLVLGAL